MLLILLVALAGGIVSGLIALCVFDAIGNTYRSIPDDIRRQLRSATLGRRTGLVYSSS